jgi:ABC-2 type transport system ATP-binding protein
MTMPSDHAIETNGLRKRYGRKEVVAGLTLDVPRGSICALLGRNGAGKTTTLKMLLGMTRPSGGEARVLGLAIADPAASVRIRQATAFVSEDKQFPWSATVGDLLRFTRGLYPGWRKDVEERTLRAFGLGLGTSAGRLSRGMRSRLALLLALPRGAELLLLDEPTEGLDPAAVEETLAALVSLGAETGATIVFSSHQLPQAERIADRVCVIDEGRVVVNDEMDALKASYRRVHVVFDGEAPRDAFAGARRDGRTLSILASRDVDDVVEKAKSLRPRSVEVRPVTLHEIFLDASKGATS